MAFNRFYVISPLALIAVSACRSPYVAESAVSGAVVKGPLSNALVFLDYNDDGELDRDNEPFAQTDSFGEYELTATQDTYTLIAMATDQTVDTSSGAALSGITLKAPSGATVITPTTTLMEEGDISAEEVAAVLGLPDGVDPLSFNPFNVDENDAAAVAAALEVEKVSQQIMTAVTSFASAAEGAGAGAGDAFTAALGSVVDVVKAKAEKIDDPTAAAGDAELDFTDAADLALIKTEATSKAAALDGIDAATMNALADDTTDAIQNVNEKIATVTDLDDQATKNIFSTMQVLQDQVKDAAETQKAGGTGNISFKNSDAVDTAALNSAPSAITLSGDRLVSADGELVVGTVATIDPDTDDTTFTYTLAGDDAKFFDFDASSGELSLKEAPDFNVKPYYEITIITKDPGGKPYAETFIIDVVPEFGSLVDPDPTVASDFNTIVLQNPLFMQMSSAIELKQTSDGQLVLVELMSSEDDEYSSPSDSEGDGPINAFINVSDRGYELRNPANNEYMGGFFTYEQDGLTYTGYEVLVDDMSVLAKYDTDLTKYFDPESTYGTGELTYTARDIEAVAIAGVKVVDKDGVTVQDMLGFNHYGEDMNPLGSAGVDVADPSVPYYIEVVGEYDPAVTTNITATDITVLHDASVGLEMQTLLQSAAEAVLYGDDHDHDEGEDAVNGGDIVTSDGSTIDGEAVVEAVNGGNETTDEVVEEGEVEVAIDISGPVFTKFELKNNEISLGEKIEIEFEATDQTHVGFFNATFSEANNPSSKISIEAQNTENNDKLPDYFNFFLNSNGAYELSFPLIIEGELKTGNYILESLSLSDANTKTDPVVDNETIYGSSQLDAESNQFFSDLESENTYLAVTIPVLDDDLNIPIINELESNATLNLANQILPKNLVKGDVWPDGEDWFKFEITEPGTIIAQMDIGNRSADLKLFGPDEIEITSKEVSEVGMIHHATSELGEYYLLVGDGSASNSPYELIVDIV